MTKRTGNVLTANILSVYSGTLTIGGLHVSVFTWTRAMVDRFHNRDRKHTVWTPVAR
jgi:hypothetical protein